MKTDNKQLQAFLFSFSSPPGRAFFSIAQPPISGQWRPGWKDCCCGWLLLDLLEIPTMLCSVAVSGVMLPTVPDLHKKEKTGMERSGSTPSALRRGSLPGVSCTGGAPTAAEESHCCWTAAGTYVRADLYLYTFGLRTCVESTTLTYLAVSSWLTGCGERGT